MTNNRQPTHNLNYITTNACSISTFYNMPISNTNAPTLGNMAKGKYLPKDEVVLQHPIIVFLFLVLGFIVMDPFDLSPVGGHDFRPVKNDIASYDQVMENWPKDNHSRLALGDQVFVDEVFGPESLEFDIYGRGPYAGLADGRIVRWMGQDGGGWETFAFVSKNW